MMERPVGIEPTITGWKPIALPLGYGRIIITHHLEPGDGIEPPRACKDHLQHFMDSTRRHTRLTRHSIDWSG